MTPDRLHDLAARTQDALAVLIVRHGNDPRHVGDWERLASDLAAYDLAAEGLARHCPLPDGGCNGCLRAYYPCPDAEGWAALRDAAVQGVERTARLYGVEP